jgi:glycosyltransferase involved in cell wall biosynthesis
MKKVLVITYYWPPSGGSGVQRWLKFVKYFRDFGIEPIILTVDPNYATFPSIDDSLYNDIPSGIEIHHTKANSPFRLYKLIRGKSAPQSGFASEKKPGVIDKLIRFIRGNFFIPDARIGWNKYALIKAKELIKTYKIDTVITTSPPHSTQLVGLELKSQLRITWIADLRDPWTEIYYNEALYRTRWAERKDKILEKRCIEAADKIIVVSNSIAESLITKYLNIETKISVIPNGYDTDDFVELNIKSTNNKYISYIGNLGPNYPISLFLEEFKHFVSVDSSWKLRFVGNIYDQVLNEIKSLDLIQYVELIPYVEHKKAVEFMLNSEILLLIIPETKENKGILTGKIFEYLGAKKPVIYIGPPNGDAVKILSGVTQTLINDYSEIKPLNEFLSNSSNQKFKGISPEIYSRKSLTEKLVNLIRTNE